jgi:PAS domain S-box-containing protein
MAASHPEGSQDLRRSLRDLVALTMLPTVWARYQPAQICADLVDVVARMIDADGVFLTAPANGVEQLLWLRTEDDQEAARILREEGNTRGTTAALQVASYSFSFQAGGRFAVGARRPGFPSEMERLILQVAVNQAATWLEWKRAETAAATEAAFRRAIESSMLAGVAVVDPEGRQTYVNRAFAAMVGWEESELIGRTPPFPYWPPEEAENIAAALRDVLAGKSDPAGYELRFRRRDERRFDALVLISPFQQPGTMPGFLASVYDITERKNAERTAQFLAEAGAILNRSLDYEETLRAISTLVVPRFADWCFVDLVEAAGGFRRIAVAHPPGDEPLAMRLRRIYGPADTLYGLSDTVARGTTFAMNDVVEQVLDQVAGDDDHRAALRAMGIRCFVSVPMLSQGRTFGVITFLGTTRRTSFDAHDIALAEELARRAALAVDNARLYRNAQEANRAKDEFLANLSHELRTPMTAILGWTHLLLLGDLEPDQLDLGLRTIRQSGEAQAKLIDDLLDVSRIVTGKLHLTPVPVDLTAILQNAVAAIRPAAEAKKQRLEIDLTAGTFMVLGEGSRLQQVFWNLLSNAVKFTPPGGLVRIAAAESGRDVVVTVEDTGDGIAAEFLPLVFERFRQAATAQRGRTGLGLGLAIAKELVELHGGSIVASSAGRGLGATFTVSLPLLSGERASPGRAERSTPRHERLRAVRVLLVEDDQSTRTLLATILSSFGADVADAASAVDAEAALINFEPQVLVTDIEMPGNDGIVLLETLRAKRGALPAIAVSGHADDGSRARVAAAGFNGFIAKPLDPLLLADEIVRALNR